MAEKKKAAPPKPVVRIVDPAEREKVLKTAMAQLEKKFGEGTVMFMARTAAWISRAFPPVRSCSTWRLA